MSDTHHYKLNQDICLWPDIQSAVGRGVQLVEQADFFYGIIDDVRQAHPLLKVIRLRTIGGVVEVKFGPGTMYIGCLPVDLVKGNKIAVAVNREDGALVVFKVMLFSCGSD